jgi:hypothetical protein
MLFTKIPATMVATVLISCMDVTIAPAQVTGQAFAARVYSMHTNAVGGCPSLDWHIVVGENNTLSGMIGANEMKTVFRVTGSYDANKAFHLSGHEVGGSRTGAVNGQIQGDGQMAATLGGLPVGAACQGKTVYVRWNNPVDNFTAGGGG